MLRITFHWLPRVLAILFIAFLSLFALDVFQNTVSPWQTALALTIHLIPSLILLVATVLAWRWEWIGALVFGATGFWMLYAIGLKPLLFHQSTPDEVFAASLIVAAPALLIAVLFLLGWLMRRRTRATV